MPLAAQTTASPLLRGSGINGEPAQHDSAEEDAQGHQQSGDQLELDGSGVGAHQAALVIFAQQDAAGVDCQGRPPRMSKAPSGTFPWQTSTAPGRSQRLTADNPAGASLAQHHH